MQQNLIVNNIRRFNDTVEGKNYNFTKVSLQMPISSRNENAFGVDSVECNLGDSSLFEKFVNMKGKLPAMAKVEYEMTTKGIDLISLEFLPVAAASKA